MKVKDYFPDVSAIGIILARFFSVAEIELKAIYHLAAFLKMADESPYIRLPASHGGSRDLRS